MSSAPPPDTLPTARVDAPAPTGAVVPPEPSLADEPSPVRGISRNVFLIGLVSFCNEMATSMLYPVIPIFLATMLGASYAATGLVEGTADAVTAGLKGASGWFGDCFGRKKQMVTLGYLLSALAKPVLGLAFGWPMVLGARVLDRLGNGLRSAPRDAMIADAASPAARGRAFGFHSAADTAGGVVGPLIALGLIAWLGEPNLRPIVVLALLPGLAAVALMALTRDRAPAPRKAARRLPRGSSGRGRSLASSPSASCSASSTRPMPSSSCAPRTWGSAPPCADGSEWVWPLFAVYGAYIALTDGVGKALLTDLAPRDSRGTVLGMYQLALGLTALAGSVLAGALWDLVGAPAPFWLGAGGALAAALLLLALPLRPTAATTA